LKKLSRMLCVVTIFGLGASSVAASWGEWTYTKNIDPMSDEDTSMALMAIQGEGHIMVRCDGSNDYDINISVGEFIGGDLQPVSYRVDDQASVDAGSWGLSTDSKSVFAPDRMKSEILKKFMSGQKIIFQITDFRGSKPYSEFSLSGSSNVINQLACIQ